VVGLEQELAVVAADRDAVDDAGDELADAAAHAFESAVR
jgi:hypothetical protein